MKRILYYFFKLIKLKLTIWFIQFFNMHRDKNMVDEEVVKLDIEQYYARTQTELKNCLSKVKSKRTSDKNSFDDYILLLHLECLIRQKIKERGPCPIDKVVPNLTKALNCACEIYDLCQYKGEKYQLWALIAKQESACILVELNRFDEENYLNEVVKIHEDIRNSEFADKQLLYLSHMNEAKIRLELAIKHINSKENFELSLQLSEKARDYYEYGFSYLNVTFQNQLYALMELSKLGTYGFEIEMKGVLKKFINKIGSDLTLSNLKLDFELVELGIHNINKLDSIFNSIDLLKGRLYEREEDFQELIIFEGKLFLKKAECSNDKWDKIAYLNRCAEYFDNHFDFKDNYYNVQSLFYGACARLELAKQNIESVKNLKKALGNLLICLSYYEEIPFQNNEYFYPLIGLYLSKTGKELCFVEKNLHEKYEIIKKTLLVALKFFEENYNKEKVIECYLELGDLFYNLGDYDASYSYLNEAINLVEIMRASIYNLDIKKKFFEKASKLFELMILTCYHLDKKEEVLKFVELSKHRIFLDKISENRCNKFIEPIDGGLIQKLDKINSEIYFTLNKLKNCDQHDFKVSSDYKKLSQLKWSQEQCIIKIKKEFSQYYDYYYNHVFDYKKLNLKDKTIIEYYYAKGFLLIILIEDDKLLIKKIDFEDNYLINLINDFKNQLSADDVEKTDDILNGLFDVLIKPIRDEISKDELLIIPYKGLHNIPFNCLNDGEGNYIIDKYIVTIAQSGSSIKYIENNIVASNDGAIVIGNPTNDLVYAEKEAKTISNILKANCLIGKDATKSNILNQIEGKRIIHFAGHGNFDVKNPLESKLKLYGGQMLYIKDLENLKLNSELIVLSACETGIVSVDDSDETEGFVKYLQIDGVKYIIASLWRGFDYAAFELFKKFYSFDGDYSKRLRLAQLELKKDGKDIFYWGNFQIYGI